MRVCVCVCVCVCVPLPALATKPPSAFCAYSKQLQAEAQSACFVHPSFVSVEQSPWTRLHLCLVALQAPWRQKGAPGSNETSDLPLENLIYQQRWYTCIRVAGGDNIGYVYNIYNIYVYTYIYIYICSPPPPRGDP